jgi:hypothetical protein
VPLPPAAEMLLQALFGWFVVWVVRTQVCRGPRSPHAGSGLIREPSGKLTGSFFHVTYETSLLNERIARWFNPTVRWKRELLEVWFSGGVLLMGLGQCLSLLTFTYILYQSLVTLAMHHDVLGDDVTEHVESPIVMPSADVKFEHLVIFWICTLIVLLVHELGHAAAASMERLHIQGFGVFFALLFPGAYVRVEDSIQYLPTRAQLRIYSAGVWHNFCFALMVFIAVELGPLMLSYSPFHHLPLGLTVLGVLPSSPLYRAVPIGSVVTALNGIELHQVEDFEQILTGYAHLLRTSYALPSGQQDLFKNFLHIEIEDDDAVAYSSTVVSAGSGFCRDLGVLQMHFDEAHADMTPVAVKDYDPLDCCMDLFSGREFDSDGYCFSVSSSDRPNADGLSCLSPRDVFSSVKSQSQSHSYSHSHEDVHTVDPLAGGASLRTPLDIAAATRSSNSDFCLTDSACSAGLACLRPLSPAPLSLLRLEIRGRAEPLIVEYPPSALSSALKFSAYSLNSDNLNELFLNFPPLYKFVLNLPSLCYFFCWLCVQVKSIIILFISDLFIY